MKKQIIFFLLVVILGELIWAQRFFSRPLIVSRPRKAVPTPEIEETFLVLAPANGTFKMGEPFELEVRLEAKEDVYTDGVDLILSFDPTILTGIKIKNENFYPSEMINLIDNQKGKIRFSAINPLEGKAIKGGGKVATVTFKAKKEGTTQVIFDFLPGLTKDTNVALTGAGTDILSQVVNGEYLIK